MSISNSQTHTQNPLPIGGQYGGEMEYEEEEEEEEEEDVKDDISDLTFDHSTFDTSIYTQSPLQRDLEQQSVTQSVQSRAQSRQSQAHGEMELSERNVRRFGARKGYAPALHEESESESESSSVRHGGRTQNWAQSGRPPPPSRRQLMTEDFTRRVQEASTFESRFYNMSTLVIVGQLVMMAIMIRAGGILPLPENMMLGPSVSVMLDYGAQQGGFIIYEHQWWRLGSAMFVHAGLLHLACNVYVQWQVCGFLSALWGRFTWLLIFFASGLCGNLLSVIHSPDQVGVGSSGGLMGVLAAWAVFIVITWKLVPEGQRAERNKQLCSLVVNIVIVILIGQLQFVDGSAHLGGMVQGALLALFLLSDEQESTAMKWFIRVFSLGTIILLYLWIFVIAWPRIEPSEEVLLQYE